MLPMLSGVARLGTSLKTAAIIVAAVLVVGTLWFASQLRPLDRTAAPVEVIIPSGVGASGISHLLEDEGVVRHWAGVSVYAALTGRQSSLQAGRYLLCPCDAVPDIVRAIATGAALSDDRVITVPEGLNIWDMDALFAREGLAEPGQFLHTYGELEGELFPDTYRIGKDDGYEAVVMRMKEEHDERTRDYSEEHIVLASMLEKEAKTPEDMALVAGIIYERLERAMLLQIDATVAYGWCLRRQGIRNVCDVTQAPIRTEIGVDGPYNTYTRGGLPPGPISNPGAAALYAAAHPQESDYLYYLSTRDGSRIVYARTLDEHLENRRIYLGL